MKLLGLGDNVFDAYLFRDELYPGGNAANVSVLARRIGAEYTGYLGELADDPPGRHFRHQGGIRGSQPCPYWCGQIRM
mgnify:CR=1 FL=1